MCEVYTDRDKGGTHPKPARHRVESIGSCECTSLMPARGGKKKKGMAPGHFCMYWGKIVKHVSAKHRYKNRVKSHLPLLHCHSLKSSLSKMSAACHAEWFKWEESGVQERALLFFNSEVSNTTLFKAACETVLVLRMPNDDSLNF